MKNQRECRIGREERKRKKGEREEGGRVEREKRERRERERERGERREREEREKRERERESAVWYTHEGTHETKGKQACSARRGNLKTANPPAPQYRGDPPATAHKPEFHNEHIFEHLHQVNGQERKS